MLFALLAFAILSPLAAAHSWVEEYQVISDNGTFTGPRGYSRGYVSRTDPTYNGFSLMWMLPSLEARKPDGTVRNRIDDTDLVCHPAQRTSNYTTTFPKLKVSPGDYVAMKYLENGHVSLPWNITGKPYGGGSVFVFGTTKPSAEEKIGDVMQWTRDGKGGNGNGWLMAAQNFDDGRCHQINCGSISQERQILQPNHVAGQPTSTVESWCENDVLIPENVAPGTLTTYWVWDFGTESNRDCNTPAGKDEYYTTCADFDIVEKSEMVKMAAAEPAEAAPVAESNPQTAAVPNYKNRTAYMTAPSYVPADKNSKRDATASIDTAFVSSCNAQATVISANNLGLWPEVYVPNTCQVISSFGTAAASAWSQTWDEAAASYTSGAKNAWEAAFKAADMPVPSRAPWSQPPNTGAAPAPTDAPSAYGGGSITATTSAADADATSAPGQLTTIVTVVTLTSTMPVSQATSPSAYASSSASASASTSAVASSAPSAYSPPSSAAPSSPAAYSTSTSAATNPVAIPTLKTVSGYAAPAAPSSSSSTDAAPAVPTVAANGTVYQRRDLTSGGVRRSHPRNFFPAGAH
ncbi:hypothetical protein CBER1_06781 [Cercospora berteroae]|uniref:DUF7492 domain-containing protein n=1 Tax=Cercospora berteroae TaxID=357750 RepID=A0A2S6BRC3_9PEZI|nr:hypothetical protein CBER1_06781 [Cercospora berteroae]